VLLHSLAEFLHKPFHHGEALGQMVQTENPVLFAPVNN
jgi:hypothetical protein